MAICFPEAKKRTMPRTETKSSSPGFPFWPENVITPEGALGNLMKNAQATMDSGYRAISDETLHFINKRLEHNSEIIEQCRDCTDVGALMIAQQKWMMDLAHDYYDEAVRMSEVTRKMIATGLGENAARATDRHAEKSAHA